MQTAINAQPLGLPGQLAGHTPRVEPAYNEEASASIAYGLAVKRGSAEGLVKLIADAHLDVGTLAGIAVYFAAIDRDTQAGAPGTGGVLPKAPLGLLRVGSVTVKSEDAVTPASEVHIRTKTVGANVAGQFRGTRLGEALVVADFNFTADAGTNLITAAAHGLKTGDGPFRVSNSGGALPAPLAAGTDYWIIFVSANTFMLATSLANALAGTFIDLTTNGTGTQTMADVAGTERLITVDVSKFCSWRRGAGAGAIGELEVDFVHSAAAALG